MSRRTNAQLDADKLRAAAEVYRAYGQQASANVAEVVADAIEKGTRRKEGKAPKPSDDPFDSGELLAP